MSSSRCCQLVGLPRTATAPSMLSYHLAMLNLKWRSGGEASDHFKGYLSLNTSGELLATGASELYVDSRLEIWDVESLQLVSSHDTDTSSSSCFSWLSDNRYFTGSNDSLIRLWDEGRCEAVLPGHSDWIRSLAVNNNDSLLLSGGMDGEVGIWDVQTLRKVSGLKVSGRDRMNSIQGISFSKEGWEVLAVTREGEVCGYDIRSLRPIFQSVTFTQFPGHTSKTNNLQVSDTHSQLLTSGRDSALRLWDLRRLPVPLQTYNRHTCKMFPIGGKFLNNEMCVVTGSEDNSAYVYDTLTGEVLRRIEMGTHVTQVEPISSSDIGFYTILYQNQRLGLVDVHGSDVAPEAVSPEESLHERMKVAMQEVLWEMSNQIYQHLRVIGRFNMIGYGNLLEALQDTASTNEGSRGLLQEVSAIQISSKYEQRVIQGHERLPSIATVAPQPAPCQFSSRPSKKCSVTPRVHSEKGGVAELPTFYPSQ